VTNFISGYDDRFATTSPVGSFPPNQFGLFDLGGNVREWVEDYYDETERKYVLRGAAWNCATEELVRLSARVPMRPGRMDVGGTEGFRCVIAVTPGEPSGNARPTPEQKRIRECKALGKIKQVANEHGFVLLDAGSENGMSVGDRYAVRRADHVVGRIVITTVELQESIGNVDLGVSSIESLRIGDDIIIFNSDK
jgi:hypothetical protein